MSEGDAMRSTEVVVQEFIDELDQYCLHASASWLSQLLLSASEGIVSELVHVPSTTAAASGSPLEGKQRTRLALARQLFTQQEYKRANYILTSQGGPSNAVGVFLAHYATYLDTMGSTSLGELKVRLQLEGLKLRMEAHLEQEGYKNVAQLHWLLGAVLKELGLTEEAATHQTTAVTLQPLLWCAWQDLAALITKERQLHDLAVHFDGRIQFPWMLRVFLATAKSQLSLHAEARGEWEALLAEFPTSGYLNTQLGVCLYQRKDLDRAWKAHSDAHNNDPYALEGCDEFSNVLFVKSEKLALSTLAQECFAVDPHRAESNVVAGNYYALTRRHEKSLLHFRRAVTIDPKCLSAWTLMGHEYLEVKNTHAAAEAYRSALAIDQRDFRAWYGLGQIYELLQMYHYALHYYWQTTVLRPGDSRMWTAVAGCLEKQFRVPESIACVEKAEECESSKSEYYPGLAQRVAAHYANHGNSARAAVFYEKLVNAESASQEHLIIALPYLIEHKILEATDHLDIPARSPSFEPAHSHGRHRTSVGRPSMEIRKRTAETAVVAAETLMAQLESLLPEATRFGAIDGLNSRVSRIRSELDMLRNHLGVVG